MPCCLASHFVRPRSQTDRIGPDASSQYEKNLFNAQTLVGPKSLVMCTLFDPFFLAMMRKKIFFLRFLVEPLSRATSCTLFVNDGPQGVLSTCASFRFFHGPPPFFSSRGLFFWGRARWGTIGEALWISFFVCF